MVARQSRWTMRTSPLGQANLRVVAVLGHELRGDAGRAHELPALALLQLDVVDRRCRAGCARSGRLLPGLMSALRLDDDAGRPP